MSTDATHYVFLRKIFSPQVANLASLVCDHHGDENVDSQRWFFEKEVAGDEQKEGGNVLRHFEQGISVSMRMPGFNDHRVDVVGQRPHDCGLELDLHVPRLSKLPPKPTAPPPPSPLPHACTHTLRPITAHICIDTNTKNMVGCVTKSETMF